MDSLHRAVVFSAIGTIVRFATDFESQYQQSWDFVLNEIQKAMLSDPSAKLELQVGERLFGSMRASLLHTQ